MTFRQIVTHLYHSPEDAFYYWQGIFRYYCLKRPALAWLLRWHIVDQYNARKKAAQKCYYAGSCHVCSCTTPELFFADKACAAGSPKYRHTAHLPPCYPPMMSQTKWYFYQMSQPHEPVQTQHLPAG